MDRAHYVLGCYIAGHVLLSYSYCTGITENAKLLLHCFFKNLSGPLFLPCHQSCQEIHQTWCIIKAWHAVPYDMAICLVSPSAKESFPGIFVRLFFTKHLLSHSYDHYCWDWNQIMMQPMFNVCQWMQPSLVEFYVPLVLTAWIGESWEDISLWPVEGHSLFSVHDFPILSLTMYNFSLHFVRIIAFQLSNEGYFTAVPVWAGWGRASESHSPAPKSPPAAFADGPTPSSIRPSECFISSQSLRAYTQEFLTSGRSVSWGLAFSMSSDLSAILFHAWIYLESFLCIVAHPLPLYFFWLFFVNLILSMSCPRWHHLLFSTFFSFLHIFVSQFSFFASPSIIHTIVRKWKQSVLRIFHHHIEKPWQMRAHLENFHFASFSDNVALGAFMCYSSYPTGTSEDPLDYTSASVLS